MTIKESVQIQERLSKTLGYTVATISNLIPDTNNRILTLCNDIAKSLGPAITIPDYSGMSDTISPLLQNIISMGSKIDYQGIATAISEISGNILNGSTAFNTMAYQSILDSLVNTLDHVEPYLPQEKKAELKNTVQPILSKESKVKLTLSDILTILSLLVSILFGIIASRPSDQLERLIEQNEIIISQQDAIISQLTEEDERLLNALNSLTDSIDLLSEEVELLRDELESTDDTSNSQTLLDAENSQDEYSDTED